MYLSKHEQICPERPFLLACLLISPQHNSCHMQLVNNVMADVWVFSLHFFCSHWPFIIYLFFCVSLELCLHQQQFTNCYVVWQLWRIVISVDRVRIRNNPWVFYRTVGSESLIFPSSITLENEMLYSVEPHSREKQKGQQEEGPGATVTVLHSSSRTS